MVHRYSEGVFQPNALHAKPLARCAIASVYRSTCITGGASNPPKNKKARTPNVRAFPDAGGEVIYPPAV
ncbi:hypothetical protein HOE425_320255 [Hoeflea sp. EC-HK425]|nr:hypothetical protein HOE425_320255 [Hoeflea sp. EC-HK425]